MYFYFRAKRLSHYSFFSFFLFLFHIPVVLLLSLRNDSIPTIITITPFFHFFVWHKAKNPFSAATDRCKSACFEHFSKFPHPKTCGNSGVLIPLLLEEHSLFFPSRLKNIPLPAAVQPVRERDISQCSFLYNGLSFYFYEMFFLLL